MATGWRPLFGALLAGALAGCGGLAGSLPVGSPVDEVERQMGPPALRWRAADGGETLVYPRGPQGFQTYFVRIDAGGRLSGLDKVLDTAHFARLQAGMTADEVLHVLGPPVTEWTVYFAARDELVWEWRYCDDWHEPARFNVLFERSTMRVRSTQAATEQLRGVPGSGQVREWCGH